MQMILPSTYVQYTIRDGKVKDVFLPFWSNVKGQTSHSKLFTIKIRLLIIIAIIIIGLLFVIPNWKRIIDSMIPPCLLQKDEDEKEMIIIESYQTKKFLVLTLNFLGMFYFVFNLNILLPYEDFKARYYSIIPHSSALLLSLTHFESKPSLDTLSNLANITRNYLPKGRYWLDEREDPVFPEVHGDFRAFCAYNKKRSQICEKVDIKNDHKEGQLLTQEELPNIIFLMVESFNPATFLISDEFLKEHVSNPNSLKTDTPFYNESAMPFLHKFAKEEAVTFSGMQTLGLPSHSGLHSLLTQEPPSQSYMNFINGWQDHVDDFPSYFREKGYRSMILNANKFNFDGKNLWIYKRGKREEAKYRLNCLSSYGDSFNDTLQRRIGDFSFVDSMKKECSEEEIDQYLAEHKDIYDFPQLFDYAAAYYPTKEQAKEIGIDPDTIYDNPKSSVSSDRIVSKQVEAHWTQQKKIMKRKGEKRPILTLVSSVDGHRPYHGYDMPQFYSVVNESIKPNTEEMRVALFFRVYNFTDEYYLKELINWLKENDPNTIVLMSGDHGTRDVPAKVDLWVGEKILPRGKFFGEM